MNNRILYAGVSSLCRLMSLLCIALSPALNAAQHATKVVPAQALQSFTEAVDLIKTRYVDTIDDAQLMRGAIAGMVSTLDPHSSYMTQADIKALQQNTSGEYAGVGINVIDASGVFRITKTVKASPAERAGLLANDVLIGIDDTDLSGMVFAAVVDKLHGEPGTVVHLRVRRAEQKKPLEFTLTRAIIIVESVDWRVLDNGLGYLHLSQFQAHSDQELQNAVAALNQFEPLRGVILDLRDNPGGLFKMAVTISDEFLNDGVIVSRRTRTDQQTLSASEGDVLHNAPMVVLINGGSASAAEILAGALQDRGRAVLVGTRSYGKGSVQTVLALSDNSAIKLTTDRYYTPSGRSIQAVGITPDVVVAAGQIQTAHTKKTDDNNAIASSEQNKTDTGGANGADAIGDNDNNEAKLPHALAAEAQRTGKASGFVTDDVQLAMAFGVLKGLTAHQ